MPKSAKSFRDSLRKSGTFFTPKPLAEYMRSLFPEHVEEIYDPTCGDGALLAEFPDAKKFGQEIDEEQGKYAAEHLPDSVIKIGDTLKDNRFKGRKFKYIIGNPPFSVAWEQNRDERFDGFELAPKSKADYAFILHCLHMLDDSGICVLMLFPGTLYRGNAEGKIRKRLVELNFVESVTQIEGGDFEDTSISTVIVVFRKNRESKTVRFTSRKLGKSRDVEIEEIARNDFNLSVSNYVADEARKEEIDPLRMQREARRHALNNIRASIELDRIVCWLEHFRDGFDHLQFLDEVRKLVDSERRDFVKKFGEKDNGQTSLFD